MSDGKVKVIETMDELKVVDPEIAAMFQDTYYNFGTPTMWQLIKELRMLRAAIERDRSDQK